MESGKVIFLTGGTGSFGKGFIPLLLSKPEISMVRVYSRDEHKQRVLRDKYLNDRISWYLGDIRDYDNLKRSMEGSDWVVHAAALKQAPWGEIYPIEFIKTNVYGSINVALSALENNVDKCLLISSDKAVEPINLYGATKMCAEKTFLSINNMKGEKKTKLSCTRYGNVIGTSGSFIEMILNSGPNEIIPITEYHSTRFWLTLKEANEFVWNTLNTMNGGEILTPCNLPSAELETVRKALCPNNPVRWIGLRPGDKLHEKLSEGYTSNNARKLNVSEIRELVLGKGL